MVAPVSNCKEYFEKLNDRLVKDAASGVNATFQYNLTGDGGGDWYVTFSDGDMSVHEGTAPKADVTYTMEAGNYNKMANGELDGTKAYMMRKLKVNGNHAMAQKLKKILPPGEG